MTKRNDFDPKAYNPTFQWDFLAPKHWGTWLGLIASLPLALLPNRCHVWIADKIARKLITKRKGTIHNAWVNLALCFPEKSDQEREAILHKTLVTAGTFMLRFANLTLRSKQWLRDNTVVNGMENLQTVLDEGHKAILLVPHTWGIDIPAVLLASQDLPVSAMAKRQKNPVTDWLMHRQRVQYGGRVYERSGGIKPFIKSIRDGYLGYYLPDQDHGREHSLFIDFMGNRKATLPGLGKLAKVSRSKIVPVFAMLNTDTGKYEINIHPAWENYPNETEAEDARMMNAMIEQEVIQHPEQYMWILKLLRTQEDPDSIYNPYKDPKYKASK
ncbi:lipid A biosynthesis (KDO)2-(lauroyl)-lipid IVA acyltransferase [Vibrio sp. 10N.286.49.B3]|uniref:lauroyl-Kdo(2)-lipid IV(A) myristoyltransferase n=1 Tax=Vibrio sp. 10N.286.49.B3 TaxID=1880855 RepID=UPI000C84AFEB|nr:lauroyl-Kdo(2)-lipid IV(A) myristoyltransferase [Vibrio sp. 10N.286.49.B3]PMH45979.1 lipid A biosynthesis (KDO)2-(lauroyl)-lipid IVA acyltransferase [Vibrio sp. 10N.286.49.B3]